jgi:hypothetical protein
VRFRGLSIRVPFTDRFGAVLELDVFYERFGERLPRAGMLPLAPDAK